MKLEPDINKDGSIAEVLKPGQEILVQIAKEPISTKGPRLTSELSLAGRFLVVIPFNDKVSVSQKMERRTCSSQTTDTKHQTEKLWGYSENCSRREKSCGPRYRIKDSGKEMGR